MIDKEHAIQTVLEDMDARVRLSAIRKSLQKTGFSPAESHEIISAAIERRKAQRAKPLESNREAAIAVIGLGITLLIIIAAATLSWRVYLLPLGLLSWGIYLWCRKPRGGK